MTRLKHNCDINSNVILHQLVIWIDPNLQQENNTNTTYTLLRTYSHVDFYPFEDVDFAIFYLIREHEFTHVQSILANNLADEFFEMQEIVRVQTVVYLTISVFIFDADEQEEMDRYNHYLPYLPCRQKCWTKDRYHYLKCLIMSRDEHLLQEFSFQTNTLGFNTANII
ncbi:unnamed protein product [Rotaria sp. Silwood1]|nr:unnamed protein product [Rotaria sp. Silwood1]